MRKIAFVNGEYYHIFNRGANKQDTFLDEGDYWKFFDGLRDLNNKTYYEERLNALGLRECKELGSLQFRALHSFLSEKEKLVEIVSYSLNPNHFHLVLRQLVREGISIFMHKIGLSYTNYFNKKHEHSGHVFQGPFKAINIDSNDYLLWLLGYVNGNIEIHGFGKASDYSWSSYRAVCKELSSFHRSGGSLLSNLSVLSGLDIILPQFNSEEEFKNFVEQVIKESRTKKEIEKYLLEEI